MIYPVKTALENAITNPMFLTLSLAHDNCTRMLGKEPRHGAVLANRVQLYGDQLNRCWLSVRTWPF